ncbi:hypothetical protein L2E82_30398 [Cichorium intybus]|uniref:Uncharacterized protein n=1 Tax=Cichorium intybus TaxID=13427 RepID=A0ACB9D0Q2_CICIN|nr:hypothetical protein L2E82_30398 [Cichorium intybus]
MAVAATRPRIVVVEEDEKRNPHIGVDVQRKFFQRFGMLEIELSDGRNRSESKGIWCNTLYQDKDNSPTACSFHGHANGDRGLLALAPPHQGIDGEWSDGSGVIVYKWNEKSDRPNTGRVNWKKRWSCCGEYGENAPPCRHGWHVSYDNGFTLY